jgi:hypothetical protein
MKHTTWHSHACCEWQTSLKAKTHKIINSIACSFYTVGELRGRARVEYKLPCVSGLRTGRKAHSLLGNAHHGFWMRQMPQADISFTVLQFSHYQAE